MKKIMITGFSGFVSRHFLDHLYEKKLEYEILGVDIRPPRMELAPYEDVLKISYQECNLLDEEAFGEELEPNGLLAHLTGGADEQVALSERLSEDGRLLSVVSTQKLVNDFSSAFTLINTVVYVVIVLAAALSFTVVFTLSNTNISERERELATLKVLGFKRPEVHRYINTETLILTGIGVVIGIPLGYALARSLTWILRMPSLYFDVVVDPLTYLIAAVMAFGFTVVVNLITNRALDRVDMVGALKSAE